MKLTYDDRTHAYYVDGVRYRSVSTAAKIPDDSYRLNLWGRRNVAVGLALDSDLLERVAAHANDAATLDDLCEMAMRVAGAQRGAGRGQAAHRVTESHDVGEFVVPTALAVSVLEGWRAVLDGLGLEVVPEYVERIVLLPRQRISGRIDRVFRERDTGDLVIGDLKTGARVLEYPHSAALQLAMYANAEMMAGPLPPEGGTTHDFEPMPPVRKDYAYLIHLPEHGLPKAARVDIAAGWDAAQRIVFPTYEWRGRKDLIQPVFTAAVGAAPCPSTEAPTDGPPSGALETASDGEDLSGPGVVANDANDASAEAAANDFTGQRRAVLEALEAAGPDGLTSHELVARGAAPNVNICGARLQELRGDAKGWTGRQVIGRLLDAKSRPVTRPNARGNAAQVHVALSHEDALSEPYRLERPRPFVPAPGAVSPTRPPAPAEGPMANRDAVAALSAEYRALTAEQLEAVKRITTKAAEHGLSVSIQLLPSVRRYTIGAALLSWARFDPSDDSMEVGLAYALGLKRGRNEWPFSLAEHVGLLSAPQAAILRDAFDRLNAGAWLSFADDGSPIIGAVE